MRRATEGGRCGVLRLWGVGGNTGGRYRAGRAIPVTCRVVFGAVGAASGGGYAAVENWLEISTFGTGRVGAPVIFFGMGASPEGTDGGVLATGVKVTKPPTIIALLGGGRRIGSLNGEVANKDRNPREVGQDLTLTGRHLHHD